MSKLNGCAARSGRSANRKCSESTGPTSSVDLSAYVRGTAYAAVACFGHEGSHRPHQTRTTKMTRHSTILSLTAVFCLASLSLPALGQEPGDQYVQQGEYGYSPTLQTPSQQPAAGSDYSSEFPTTEIATYPTDESGVSQVSRLPEIEDVTPIRQVNLLADIPTGYPPVITERGQAVDAVRQHGQSWADSAQQQRAAATTPVAGNCADGNCGAAVPYVAEPTAVYGPEAPFGFDPAGYGGYGGYGGEPINGPFGTKYGNSPGLYFAYDAMYTSISTPSVGAIGSADAAGIYTSNGISSPYLNTVGTDFIDSKAEFGHRIEVGRLDDCRGWMFTILTFDQDKEFNAIGGQIQFNDPLGMLLGYRDADGDGIDDDINGNHIHGRNGEDLGVPNPLFNPPVNTERFMLEPDGTTPIYDGIPDTSAFDDTGDMLTWVPIFDNLRVRSATDIDGFEAQYMWAKRGCRMPGATTILGFRLMDIDDNFWLNASGSFLDATNVRSEIDNLIVGPTLGWNWCHRVGCWRFEGLFKTTLGVNFMRGEQIGELASNASSSTATHNQPVNLASSAFSSFREEEKFSPIIEWRVGAAYELTKWSAFRIGYTGMYIDGLSRAANATDYTLPSFGLALDGSDELNFNAFTFGFELYR